MVWGGPGEEKSLEGTREGYSASFRVIEWGAEKKDAMKEIHHAQCGSSTSGDKVTLAKRKGRIRGIGRGSSWNKGYETRSVSRSKLFVGVP